MQIATRYPDIFFTPEYSELFKDTAFGGEPCHFSYAGIDYRFYKRPIEGTPYFDIVSPYGYSGRLWPDDCRNDNLNIFDYALSFNQCCERNGIIAEFARMHPFINEKLEGTPNYHYEHDIFYIDLTKTESEIWKGFDKGCRSAIKKAERNISVSQTDFASQMFTHLYSQTMLRNQATPQYCLNDRFIFKFNETMLGMHKVFNAWFEDILIATGLFLKYGDYCHYFLSGSSGAMPESGATNLLIWEAIKWAKSQGCKIFNLGGGLKAGDTLESFKRSFSHDSKPFYTYRKIHNPEIYNQICADKGIDPAKESFFPAYRAERIKQ